MNCVNRWVLVGLIAAVLPMAGCGRQVAQTPHEHPAEVEHIEGSEISKVTLTDLAMKRLDVRTSAVTQEQSPRIQSAQKAVPYSALIYDPQGNTWVYVSPESRVFMREPVEVDYIEGDLAYLTSGPEVGTTVATVGVAELYGTEFEVGH